jgi:porin
MGVVVRVWRIVWRIIAILAVVAAPSMHRATAAERAQRAAAADPSPAIPDNDPLLVTPGIDRALADWYALKRRLDRDHALWFAVNYTALLQGTTASKTGVNSAAGGVFDIYGVWTAFGRGTGWQGVVGFRFADQSRYGRSVVPSRFGAELGSNWGTALAFDSVPFNPIELWWEQHLFDDRVSLRVGKVDATMLFDPLTLSAPFEGFLGHPFNLNSSIGFAAEGFGGALRVTPVKDVYALAGIFDANGTGRDIGTFFSRQEYLRMLEFGWQPTSSAGKGDYHVTLWETDARLIAGIPAGRGMTLSAEQAFGSWLPFIRYGTASGGATWLKTLVAAGVGLRSPFGRKSDVLGIGVSWGAPLIASQREQSGIEIFYRLQLTRQLAVTPDVQLIFHPAQNPGVGRIAVFSLRTRWSL